MATLSDGRLVKNFSLQEMANNESDTAVKLIITPATAQHAMMMQELRDWWGKSMTVNSWYREPVYNKAVGGDPNSCHLDGIATDISLTNLTAAQRSAFIKQWKKICKKYKVIGGVSIYHWGLHFDSNNDPMRYGRKNSVYRITDFRK